MLLKTVMLSLDLLYGYALNLRANQRYEIGLNLGRDQIIFCYGRQWYFHVCTHLCQSYVCSCLFLVFYMAPYLSSGYHRVLLGVTLKSEDDTRIGKSRVLSTQMFLCLRIPNEGLSCELIWELARSSDRVCYLWYHLPKVRRISLYGVFSNAIVGAPWLRNHGVRRLMTGTRLCYMETREKIRVTER